MRDCWKVRMGDTRMPRPSSKYQSVRAVACIGVALIMTAGSLSVEPAHATDSESRASLGDCLDDGKTIKECVDEFKSLGDTLSDRGEGDASTSQEAARETSETVSTVESQMSNPPSGNLKTVREQVQTHGEAAARDERETALAPNTSSNSGQAQVLGRSSRVAEARLTPGTITFSEFPAGTSITNQYQRRGVVFGGDSPFITDDGSNPTSPVLSGSPLFHGAIEIRIVSPKTASPTIAERVQFDVGYINAPNSVEITYFGRTGRRLGSARASGFGINHIELNRSVGIHRIRVAAAANEPAGFAIDNVNIGRPDPESCEAIAFIGVRGSGQGQSEERGYGRFVNEAREKFVEQIAKRYTVKEVAINYQAKRFNAATVLFAPNGMNDFLDSEEQGRDEVIRTLSQLNDACPNQLFVLVGYSQGAMAVHDALVSGAGSLSVLNQIAAVELIADPMRVRRSPTNEGSGSGPGAFTLVGGLPVDVPDDLKKVTRSYCIELDPICDSVEAISRSPKGAGPVAALRLALFLDRITDIHTQGYSEHHTDHAGVHAASMTLKALRPR